MTGRSGHRHILLFYKAHDTGSTRDAATAQSFARQLCLVNTLCAEVLSGRGSGHRTQQLVASAAPRRGHGCGIACAQYAMHGNRKVRFICGRFFLRLAIQHLRLERAAIFTAMMGEGSAASKCRNQKRASAAGFGPARVGAWKPACCAAALNTSTLKAQAC